jgi:PadR family transcriptional regulator AphA
MSLEHAILGFLNYHPYSGYDLKKIFDTSVQHFWPADQSQIYRTLRSLTEAGWVEMEKVPQEDRPDRKVYHITRKGRTELMGWLAGPPPLEGTRSAGLIQVFFAGQLPDEEIIKKFEEFAVQIRGVLALYESIPKQIEPYRQEIASSREYFFWMVTLDSGIRSMHASLEWAESVIKKLKMGMAPEK